MAGVKPAVADSTVPKIKFREPQIEMAHGAGGIASRRLVEGLFAPLLYRSAQPELNDAASLNIGGVRLAMTTDSFVVKPLSFPGGSIGELAINGTVNDLAVSGAKAEAIVVTFVLEAGLRTETLEAEVRAMARAAEQAGVAVVGGDTKVVEHGKADGMYISTTGVGSYLPGIRIDARSVRPGDKVLLSGPIGDHGITILLARGDLDFEADLCSDTRSVFPLVQAMAAEAAPGIRWMRDPTRGGVATSLNELARDCGLGIHIFRRRNSRQRHGSWSLRTVGSRSSSHCQRRPIPCRCLSRIFRRRSERLATDPRWRKCHHVGRGTRATCRLGAGDDPLRRQ